MSEYPGRFFGSVNAAQTLGSANGRTFQFIDPTTAKACPHNLQIAAAHVVLVTTATAGNRVLALRALDAAGNILCHIPISANVAASLTTRITWGAGCPNFASGNFQVASLPVEFTLPAGASIQILDQANIDVADTIAVSLSACL